MTIKGGKISATCNMSVSLKAYGIKVEEAYKDAINDETKLDMAFDYEAMK
jgi:hypothetical protein